MRMALWMLAKSAAAFLSRLCAVGLGKSKAVISKEFNDALHRHCVHVT